MILDVAWNPWALLDVCLMKLTFRDVMLILCLAARAHFGSPGRAEATWWGYHSHVAVCMQPLFSVFLQHCLTCTKCLFSYINVLFYLESMSPKRHYTYSFVIRSVTWWNCFGTIFLGNLIAVTSNNVFESDSWNNFWLEYKLFFHPQPQVCWFSIRIWLRKKFQVRKPDSPW